MTIQNGVGFKTLLAEADADVDTITIEALQQTIGDDTIVVIDLRDIRELQREGHLPGAVHMPRGMLEFWVDPDSPYARPIFQEDKRFVFYCASAWRSALACQVAGRLGLQNASHLEGGFTGWKKSGGEVVAYKKRSQ